jgi:hypothetical protein
VIQTKIRGIKKKYTPGEPKTRKSSSGKVRDFKKYNKGHNDCSMPMDEHSCSVYKWRLLIPDKVFLSPVKTHYPPVAS